MKILFFCDAHDTPDSDKRRFEKLGNWIVEHRPDYIIQGGDFLTLDSLSAWDQHKARLKEGQRYKDDIDSANYALDLMFDPLRKLQAKQRRKHEALYKPVFVWIDGNHEHWVESYIDRYPEAEGLMELHRLLNIPLDLFSEYTHVPYKDVYPLWGINFTHAVIGRTGPISSVYLDRRALMEVFSSSVVYGHTHTFSCATMEKIDRTGQKYQVMALNAGCFFEEEPRYAKGNTNNYTRCIVSIQPNGWGNFDFSTTSLEKLLGDY